nr:hypothetical protein [Tanacetum cinerariifolium]
SSYANNAEDGNDATGSSAKAWFPSLRAAFLKRPDRAAPVSTNTKTHGRSSYANNAKDRNDATESSTKVGFPSLSYGTCFIFWYTHLSLEHGNVVVVLFGRKCGISFNLNILHEKTVHAMSPPA